MRSLKYFAPAGLVRLWEFRHRFRALGLPAHWADVQEYRKALDLSQIELIPPEKIPSLKCVVDVGANVGDWSVGMALLTRVPEIIAFEPVPDVFAQLRENAKPYPQIRCVQSAIGAGRGQITLNVHRRHQMSSVLQIREEARDVHGMQEDIALPIQVRVTSLDEELSAYGEISLLKVDVQGYEPEVFDGARSILFRTEILMVEVTYASYYRGDMQFDEQHRLITSLAPFKLWGISSPHCAPSGQPLWADAVYVRSV
jgi:FkbM family methyltransferase